MILSYKYTFVSVVLYVSYKNRKYKILHIVL